MIKGLRRLGPGVGSESSKLGRCCFSVVNCHLGRAKNQLLLGFSHKALYTSDVYLIYCPSCASRYLTALEGHCVIGRHSRDDRISRRILLHRVSRTLSVLCFGLLSLERGQVLVRRYNTLCFSMYLPSLITAISTNVASRRVLVYEIGTVKS